MDKILIFIKNLFNKISNKVNYINGSENLAPPLSKEEEDHYIDLYQKGNIYGRNKLIEHNLRLVVYVAKRYETNLTNLEDLISIGTIGLVKAINTFKMDKNIKLATYASKCIENEILMYLRKKSKSKSEISLDEPLKCDYDGNELLLGDILSTSENEVLDTLFTNEDKSFLYSAIQTLKPREIEILSLRFGLNGCEELTQKETADKLGISQSYISRLEKRIIKKLNENLKDYMKV